MASGVREVAFRISHRPDVKYERVRELFITYDNVFGRMPLNLLRGDVTSNASTVGEWLSGRAL